MSVPVVQPGSWSMRLAGFSHPVYVATETGIFSQMMMCFLGRGPMAPRSFLNVSLESQLRSWIPSSTSGTKITTASTRQDPNSSALTSQRRRRVLLRAHSPLSASDCSRFENMCFQILAPRMSYKLQCSRTLVFLKACDPHSATYFLIVSLCTSLIAVSHHFAAVLYANTLPFLG